MTRRDLLMAGAVSAAALASAQGSDTKEAPAKRFKVGVHSFSLRKFSIEEAARITAGFGVAYLGLNGIHLAYDSPPDACGRARALLAEHGLTPLACGVVPFDADEAASRKVFEYARAMGMPTIVAYPSADSFDMLDRLVDEFDLRVAIHNHGPGSRFSVPEDTLKAVKGHDARIGACADLGHYERSGIRAHDALDALRDRLYDVHLKDVDRRREDGVSTIVGKGVIDWPRTVAALLEAQFDGHAALEYEEEPDSPQQAMAASFRFFNDAVRAALAAAS